MRQIIPLPNLFLPQADSAINFVVEKRGQKLSISSDDILVIQAQGDYVDLVTSEQSYLYKDTMVALENQLSAHFVRVHRSTLVNRNHAKSLEKRPGGLHNIILSNAQSITVSRTYKLNAAAIFNNKNNI